MSMLAPAVLIARKDLKVEARTKDVLTSVGLFGLLVVVAASFSFPTTGEGRQGVAAGMLWMAFLFAALLGLGRSFALEKEEGCMEGLMASPAPRESIFLGKLFANLIFTGLAEIAIIPISIMLLQLEPGTGVWLLLGVTALGTLGLLTVGSLFAAMAVNTRTREAILPILVIPVAIPLLIASVKATEVALLGKGIGDAMQWILLLAFYTGTFLFVALFTFPYVLEE